MRKKIFALLIGGFLATSLDVGSVQAQPYPPGVKEMLAGSKAPAMQRLVGVVRIRKDFGVVPMGPGHSQPSVYPCAPFRIAVYDARSTTSKPLAVSDGMMKPGLDDGEFYTCKYEVTVPAEVGLYTVPVMGGTLLLPKEDRSPMYITDAWIGGTRSKPPRGWERGFAGKYVTLGKAKATYLKFDMVYARVDPN